MEWERGRGGGGEEKSVETLRQKERGWGGGISSNLGESIRCGYGKSRGG